MMSASAEGAERLAKILREILALSETKRPNHLASADDPDKVFEAHSVNGTHQACAREKQASEQSSGPEHQASFR